MVDYVVCSGCQDVFPLAPRAKAHIVFQSRYGKGSEGFCARIGKNANLVKTQSEPIRR